MNDDGAMQRFPLYVVEPPKSWRLPDLAELWRYRDLFVVLCWRELKLRYRQTLLGIAWVVLQPLLSAIILAAIFSHVAGSRSAVPYLLIVFTGIAVWQLFASGVQRGGSSLVMDANLITKVYFPRMIVPLSAIAAAVVDFAVSSVVIAVAMAFYRVVPGWHALLFPLFAGLAALAATGVGLWIGALNVRYRDFVYAAPFVLQLWMFASPVVYVTDVIPVRWRIVYELNPAVGFIEATRWALLSTPWPGRAVLLSLAVSSLLCITGALVFRHVERDLTDVI